MSIQKINVQNIYPCAGGFLLSYADIDNCLTYESSLNLSMLGDNDVLVLANNLQTKEFRNACALEYARRSQAKADKELLRHCIQNMKG